MPSQQQEYTVFKENRSFQLHSFKQETDSDQREYSLVQTGYLLVVLVLHDSQLDGAPKLLPEGLVLPALLLAGPTLITLCSTA
jgi:hypothetical protein